MTSLFRSAAARLWALVAVATLLVAGCPIAFVWWLRTAGVVTSSVYSLLLGTALSLIVSQVGRIAWERHPRSEDLLFSELMVWGFLRRARAKRRLADALDMVRPMSEAQQGDRKGLSVKQQAGLLEQLTAEIETRDPYLHGHSRRVARYSWIIARRLGLPKEDVARIRTAAAIHDIGKIRTPKAILHKPGRLTDEEYAVIKRHPDDGAQMVDVLNDSKLTAIVRHHHERLDGTGYPSRLTGEEIPRGARIIAVADTFDAITSLRPYRPASTHRAALEILREEAGTRLDPAAVRAFCKHYAGRRPVLLWASVAGLPEQVISWLGEGAASAVSAAKGLAVAAVVGGTAATASVLALPLAKHSRSLGHASSYQAAIASEPPRGADAIALRKLHPRRESSLSAAARRKSGKRVLRSATRRTASLPAHRAQPAGASHRTGANRSSGELGVPAAVSDPTPAANLPKEAASEPKREQAAGRTEPEERPAQAKAEEAAKAQAEEEAAKKGLLEELLESLGL